VGVFVVSRQFLEISVPTAVPRVLIQLKRRRVVTLVTPLNDIQIRMKKPQRLTLLNVVKAISLNAFLLRD
jgi:hypothetical protein